MLLSCIAFCTSLQSTSVCCYLSHMRGPDESHTPKCLQVVAFSNSLDLVQDACWYWIAKYRKQFLRKWILLQMEQSGSHVSQIKVSWLGAPDLLPLSIFQACHFDTHMWLWNWSQCKNRNYGLEGRYLLHCAGTPCCWRQSKIFLEDQRLPVVWSVSKKTLYTSWACIFLIHSCLRELFAHYHPNNICHESFIYSTQTNGKLSINQNEFWLKPWGPDASTLSCTEWCPTSNAAPLSLLAGSATSSSAQSLACFPFSHVDWKHSLHQERSGEVALQYGTLWP